MPDLGSATFQLAVNAARFRTGLAQASRDAHTFTGRMQRSFLSAGHSMQNMGRTMTLFVTGPLALFAKSSVDVLGEFQDTMAKTAGIAEIGVDRMGRALKGAELQRQIDRVGKDVTQMGLRFGVAARDMAEGLYFISSAGFRAQQSMKVLRQVAISAAGGLGEMEDVGLAVVGALNAYDLKAKDAAKITDTMSMAVRKGVMEADALSKVMGVVMGPARDARVEFDEVAGAIALMTRSSIPAARAATSLRSVLMRFEDPTEEVKEGLKKMGLTAGEVRDMMGEDFIKTMFTLSSGMKDTGVRAAELFDSIRALPGFTALTVSAEDANEVMGATSRAFDQTGTAARQNERSFNIMSKSLGFVKRRFEAVAEAVRIEVGGVLEPMVRGFQGRLTGMGEGFLEMSDSQQQAILKMAGFAAAAGPVIFIMGTLIKMLGSFGLAGGIMGPAVLGVAAIGAAFGAAAIGSEDFRGKLGELWSLIERQGRRTWETLERTFKSVVDRVGEFGRQVYPQVRRTVKSIGEAFRVFIREARPFINGLIDIGKVIIPPVLWGIRQLINLIKSVVDVIGGETIGRVVAFGAAWFGVAKAVAATKLAMMGFAKWRANTWQLLSFGRGPGFTGGMQGANATAASLVAGPVGQKAAAQGLLARGGPVGLPGVAPQTSVLQRYNTLRTLGPQPPGRVPAIPHAQALAQYRMLAAQQVSGMSGMERFRGMRSMGFMNFMRGRAAGGALARGGMSRLGQVGGALSRFALPAMLLAPFMPALGRGAANLFTNAQERIGRSRETGRMVQTWQRLQKALLGGVQTLDLLRRKAREGDISWRELRGAWGGSLRELNNLDAALDRNGGELTKMEARIYATSRESGDFALAQHVMERALERARKQFRKTGETADGTSVKVRNARDILRRLQNLPARRQFELIVEYGSLTKAADEMKRLYEWSAQVEAQRNRDQIDPDPHGVGKRRRRRRRRQRRRSGQADLADLDWTTTPSAPQILGVEPETTGRQWNVIRRSIAALNEAVGEGSKQLNKREKAALRAAIQDKDWQKALRVLHEQVKTDKKATESWREFLDTQMSKPVKIQFNALLDDARADTEAWFRDLSTAEVNVQVRAHSGSGQGHSRQQRHFGGWIGGGTRADVPATLQEGEYVVNRGAAKKFGPLLEAVNKYHQGGLVKANFNLSDLTRTIKRGARASAQGLAGVGTQAGLSGAVVQIGRQLAREGYDVGEHPAFGGVAGVHTSGSWHYKNKAIDVNWPGGGAAERAKLRSAYFRLKRHPGVEELFFNGLGIPHPISGHDSHLHAAILGGGSGGGRGGRGAWSWGIPGGIQVNAGVAGLRRATEGWENYPGVPTDPEGAVKLGKQMAARRGWRGGQWNALYNLWQRESGWRWNADNPTSSAYGIPQALPGSKMASAGKDWRTNPRTQIDWGLGYIAGRYGDPIHAWAHSERVGWYGKGGVTTRPVVAGLGERGREAILPLDTQVGKNALRDLIPVGVKTGSSDAVLTEIRDALQRIDDRDLIVEWQGEEVARINRRNDIMRRRG